MRHSDEACLIRRRSLFHRIWTTIASTLLVIASLLTFPGGIPWMIGGWILGHILLVCRHRPAWAPLIAGLVVLMEIPRGFLTDPYAGVERELARQYDLELISDSAIRQLVLFSPYAPPGMWINGNHLSDDGLHPNSRGNEHLANRVARSLSRIFGQAIRRPAIPHAVENGTSGVFQPSPEAPAGGQIAPSRW
jgi:hypothetical protein